MTNVAWSKELVSQSLEALFAYLGDDGAHHLRPIHAPTLRVGWPPDQQPGDIVAHAARRYGLAPLIVVCKGLEVTPYLIQRANENQVPVLRTEAGELLTENAAVLQYIAEHFPAARLAPTDLLGRARLRECLGFIGTELHKAVFVPLLDPKAPEAVKSYAREKLALRMGVLESHLADREFLLEDFSVADAYLATVLNWTLATGVSLAEWPIVQTYHQRMLKRPSVERAFAEELALFQAGQAAARPK